MRELKFRWFKQSGQEMIYLKNAVPADSMQFTGLKDKNGKDIYEGDILSHAHQYGTWVQVIGEVGNIWGGDGYVWGWNLDEDDVKDAEVIGNIYENPDLLKKTEGQ